MSKLGLKKLTLFPQRA